MYSFFIGIVVKANTRLLNSGDVDAALRMCSQRVRFVFPGRSPLSGEFEGIDAVRSWTQKWCSLGGRLEIHSVAAAGPPWNLRIYYRFTDTIPIPGHEDYVRSGAHQLQVRWGRLREHTVFVDDPLTEVVAAGLL